LPYVIITVIVIYILNLLGEMKDFLIE